MLTQIINGRILTPQGWLKDGSVLICDGKILEVTNSDLAVIGATVIDARGNDNRTGICTVCMRMEAAAMILPKQRKKHFRMRNYCSFEAWSYRHISYFVIYFV